MRTSPYITLFIFTLIILAIDFYSFKGLRKIKLELNNLTKRVLKILFWSIPFIIVLSLSVLMFFRGRVNPKDGMVYFHYFSGTFLLFYIPKIIFIFFIFVDDLFHLLLSFSKKIAPRNKGTNNGKQISRSTFLTRIGFLIAGIPFLSIIYGIGFGKYNYIVRKSNLFFSNLPKAFEGFKIVQFSDFHLGSYNGNIEKIREIVSIINKQKPDLILFTGDLVNNVASEIDDFLPELSKLKAKYGMYSILGNHDYGDYVRWNSVEKKKENLNKLIEMEREIGFKVLLNSSEIIKISESSIRLIGVENWGLPPFPQYGKLDKALMNVEDSEFKILMSHDPTHWNEEVVGKTNIDLTLSGHTHGGQFGIEIPGWRWSPVNLRYKEWGGIYKNRRQVINVNTGVGFIGFPGRIGMPPEIGVIVLKNS